MKIEEFLGAGGGEWTQIEAKEADEIAGGFFLIGNEVSDERKGVFISSDLIAGKGEGGGIESGPNSGTDGLLEASERAGGSDHGGDYTWLWALFLRDHER
jgi:hypothetical protein